MFNFESSIDFRGLPFVVLTVLSRRSADVAAFGGGTAIALPLIPSPNTSDSAGIDATADDGRDWLRDSPTRKVDRTGCRVCTGLSFGMLFVAMVTVHAHSEEYIIGTPEVRLIQ